MPDLETLFIAVYTIVDNIYKETLVPLIGNRNGPEPDLDDSSDNLKSNEVFLASRSPRREAAGLYFFLPPENEPARRNLSLGQTFFLFFAYLNYRASFY